MSSVLYLVSFSFIRLRLTSPPERWQARPSRSSLPICHEDCQIATSERARGERERYSPNTVTVTLTQTGDVNDITIRDELPHFAIGEGLRVLTLLGNFQHAAILGGILPQSCGQLVDRYTTRLKRTGPEMVPEPSISPVRMLQPLMEW